MILRIFSFIGIFVIAISVTLVGVGVWVQGYRQDPTLSVPSSFDETPFRTYDAVVPDSPLRLKHFISESNEINVSSSLIMGEREVVVVATQATKFAAERLADEIANTGLELTYVLLGHAHLDHSQGASVLKQRFPNAKLVASPSVAKLQQLRMEGDDDRAKNRYGENAAVPSVPFKALNSDVLMIEGREIQLWHDQYGDVGIGHENEPHTVVYIPDLKALLPNDICYFEAHMMMGGTTDASRTKWKDQIRSYMEMDLQVVIPGHLPRSRSSLMTPERVLQHSLKYIEDYENALASNSSSEEVINEMLELYPDLEHTSALYLGTYINFKETHKLMFNPRIEKVGSFLPKHMLRWIDEKLFETIKESSNS